MNKAFSTLTAFAMLTCPVFAQESYDIAGGAQDSSAVEIRSKGQEQVALKGPALTDMADMAIGAASASSLKLSLSDDQLEKMAKLKADFGDAAAQKKAQLQVLNRQLKDSLTKENVQKSELMDIQGKINNLRSELANAQLSIRLETIAILTDEQKQKLRHASLQRQVFGGKGKASGAHKGHHGRRGAPAAAPIGAEPSSSPQV